MRPFDDVNGRRGKECVRRQWVAKQRAVGAFSNATFFFLAVFVFSLATGLRCAVEPRYRAAM